MTKVGSKYCLKDPFSSLFHSRPHLRLECCCVGILHLEWSISKLEDIIIWEISASQFKWLFICYRVHPRPRIGGESSAMMGEGKYQHANVKKQVGLSKFNVSSQNLHLGRPRHGLCTGPPGCSTHPWFFSCNAPAYLLSECITFFDTDKHLLRVLSA